MLVISFGSRSVPLTPHILENIAADEVDIRNFFQTVTGAHGTKLGLILGKRWSSQLEMPGEYIAFSIGGTYYLDFSLHSSNFSMYFRAKGEDDMREALNGLPH